jgi:hypothetical protein
VIRFPDATNPTVPVHSRQDHSLLQARYEAVAEVLVPELQMHRVQAEKLRLWPVDIPEWLNPTMKRKPTKSKPTVAELRKIL